MRFFLTWPDPGKKNWHGFQRGSSETALWKLLYFSEHLYIAHKTLHQKYNLEYITHFSNVSSLSSFHNVMQVQLDTVKCSCAENFAWTSAPFQGRFLTQTPKPEQITCVRKNAHSDGSGSILCYSGWVKSASSVWVWIWKTSPKNPKIFFFPFCPKKISSGQVKKYPGQRPLIYCRSQVCSGPVRAHL